MNKRFLLVSIVFLQACATSQHPKIINNAPIDNTNNAYISEEDASLKLYIVLKYPHIVEDIISGNGPYIRTLIQLANRQDKNYHAELLNLRNILKLSNSIYGFSEAVENNYRNDST